ncbi:chorismate synthase [Sphingobacteriales bacterium UPWRP_1]|nr:chorismate synthase [Sphingobacteriales bacterium TSM_CSS]PSJ73656.1 chorismate synthase [Sphingobacteriales bacterium UPWRP_1]
MAANSFGRLFRITTFGESHGYGIGVVIDGCPAGLPVDMVFVQQQLDRRRPGQSKIVTQRQESDTAELLSGVYEGRSTGAPIALLIRNANQRSKDYNHLQNAYRPSHADFTYQQKYGLRDHRGGGRSSARETAARVAAGAIAQLLLAHYGITVKAYVSQVGPLVLQTPYQQLNLALTDQNAVRCPHPEMAAQMEALILQVRKAGDTIGGVVNGLIQGVPAGLGEPVFDKLHARLAMAMLGINAAKGFEYGSGFAGAAMRGSEHNDLFYTTPQGNIATRTNFSGGIQGGISNGMDIYFRVAFKPVATILQPQPTVDHLGNDVTIEGKGRHDPCVLPRAVPIVEAMCALVMADFVLLNRCARL